MPCAAVARVDSDNTIVNSQPALVLLPPGTTLATAPSAPAGSPLNLTQFLTYAVPAPISFSPCTSVAAATACAAVATDVEDGDVTRLIKVRCGCSWRRSFSLFQVHFRCFAVYNKNMVIKARGGCGLGSPSSSPTSATS